MFQALLGNSMDRGDDDFGDQGRNEPAVRETNIEVCVRIRPLLVDPNSGNNTRFFEKKTTNSTNRATHLPHPRNLAASDEGNALFNHFGLQLPNSRTSPRKPPVPSARGSESQRNKSAAHDKDVVAWDVSNDKKSVQQSPLTERIQGRTVSYTLDRVYGTNSTTADLYTKSVQPLVYASMEGYHASVFAYGQTSTGKTFTMTGTQSSPGIIPSAIQDCFDYVQNNLQDQSREYLIRLSYLEIYNEQIIDLLNETPSSVRIFEGREGVVVKGLREEVVTTPQEVFRFLQKGESRRQVGSTNMNKHSSRSHAIVRLWLESTDINGEDSRASSLNLVDLAGSESVRLTGSTGERKREGQYINKSLMALGQVVYKLSEKHKSVHIPYRDSKLTRLLQPSLSGNAQIVVICNISPQVSHLEESHNTLKFAVRAKKIRQRAMINQVQDQNTLLQTYREEIADLRQQLADARKAAAAATSGDKKLSAKPVLATDQEEVRELNDAIQKIERLILKTQRQRREDDDLLNEEGNPDLLDSELEKEKEHEEEAALLSMHRIQGLLRSVLSRGKQDESPSTPMKNGAKANDNGVLSTPERDEEVEALKARLHEQQVTTSLKKADASFLQSQLTQKDELLEEASNVLEAVEKRQLELEGENENLRLRLTKTQEEIAELQNLLQTVTKERDKLLTNNKGAGSSFMDRKRYTKYYN